MYLRNYVAFLVVAVMNFSFWSLETESKLESAVESGIVYAGYCHRVDYYRVSPSWWSNFSYFNLR